MADKDEISKPTNRFTSLLSQFTQVINNFRLPFLPPAKKEAVKVETEKKAVVRGGEVVEVSKSTVTFPDGLKNAVAPLKLESEGAEQETNHVVLWQVYVIGGFFILKWAWGRWNEHKERKKPSNDDQPATDGGN